MEVVGLTERETFSSWVGGVEGRETEWGQD